MRKKRLGKTNLMVTPVGMGSIPIMRLNKGEAVKVVGGVLDLGINFIDTAYVYQDSEEKIGQAIKGRKREDLVIASKSPADDRETILEHIDIGLKRMGIDWIDVYQLHGVSSDNMDKRMGAGGAYEGLREAINQGKVKHPGFSTHDMQIAKELLKMQKFEVIQIQVNFIETEYLEEVVPLAESLDVGIIAMKPLAGGVIEDANLAFRFLMQYESLLPDPGIENVEEMEEIIKIVESPRPLADEEKRKIGRICREAGTKFCHWCDYCQPCPQGIPISDVLNVKNIAKRIPRSRLINNFGPGIEKAEECTECNQCIERCPYHLSIPQLLKENLVYYRELEAMK